MDLLRQIGVEILYETSTDLVGYCPNHNNRDTPAFNISKTSPYPFKCHNGKCNTRGHSIVNLFEYKGFNEQEIKDIFKFGLNNYDQFLERIFKVLDTKEEINEWDNIDPYKFRIEDKDCGYPAKTYLEGRNIGEQAYDFFGMGWSANKQKLIIPIYDDTHKFVGVVGRSIREKQYQYSHGLKRKNIIWNLNRARNTAPEIILTEGAFDAVYIWQAGHKNVGAVFGSSISDGQLGLIRKYFSGLTCFFDNDDAGRALTNSIVENVKDLNVSVVRYKQDVKDPGELNADQINEMLKQRITGIQILLGL